LCYDDIKKLNPSLKSGIVNGNDRTYQLRIPKDQHDKIKDNLHNIIASSKLATFNPQTVVKVTNDSLKSDSSVVNSVANNDADDKEKVETKKVKLFHTTSKGQKVSQIARIYGMSVRELCKLNGIKENAKLKKGKKLIVVREVNINANNTAIVKTKIKAPKVHYVQAGDTLWTISKKYGGLPIARLKKMNKLKGTNLKLGQKIIIG
jgi:membrane-bound lytic murein transglycosylase D